MEKHFGPVVRVRYQVDWPSATDPMNKFAKADVQTRVTYYKVNGTPMTYFEGVNGSPTHAKIFAKQGYTAPIKIDVRTGSIGSDNVLSGDIVITANQDMTGSYRLYIAAIERAIIYAKAPGTNGEKEFYDILRKLMPSGGQAISAISAGASAPYAFSWTVDDTKVKKEQLAVVAWVQEESKKTIVNAGMNIPTFFIGSQITEQSTAVKSGATHYIPCSIKNDNSDAIATKITTRDSTKGSFTGTRLAWFSSSSDEPGLSDSIVANVKAGDSLVFWAVTTAPSTTNAKAMLELFAENRSDPQALGWGSVRYINLSASTSGREFPKPGATEVKRHRVFAASAPPVTIRGTFLAYTIPENSRVSISLHAPNGQPIRLFSGMQRQGSHSIDLGRYRLNTGMYIAHCRVNGKTLDRIIAFVK